MMRRVAQVLVDVLLSILAMTCAVLALLLGYSDAPLYWPLLLTGGAVVAGIAAIERWERP